MNDALAIAATGMRSQQLQVEAIANNLANVATPAYKRTRTTFVDLVLKTPLAGAAPLEPELARGAGAASAPVQRMFEPAELRRTESPMDLAIQGDGFLELAMPDGSRAYTRGGPMKVNADGQLATTAGVPLKPGLHLPPDLESLAISANGRMQARVRGQATPLDLGQLELVRFAQASGLLAEGGNFYRATEASGDPIGGRPGEDGLGTLVQGALESSNVKLVDEMVQLVVAQRAYEASMKVMQAADDMLGMVNGLRR